MNKPRWEAFSQGNYHHIMKFQKDTAVGDKRILKNITCLLTNKGYTSTQIIKMHCLLFLLYFLLTPCRLLLPLILLFHLATEIYFTFFVTSTITRFHPFCLFIQSFSPLCFDLLPYSKTLYLSENILFWSSSHGLDFLCFFFCFVIKQTFQASLCVHFCKDIMRTPAHLHSLKIIHSGFKGPHWLQCSISTSLN